MGAALLGLTIGAVFGAAARISRFCLLRGMKALVGGGDRSPLRLFALALAVAILATQALNLWGLTDLSASLPMRPQSRRAGCSSAARFSGSARLWPMAAGRGCSYCLRAGTCARFWCFFAWGLRRRRA
ncbi:hypothetical protein QWZ10_04330 [Paracoccus cavernae]|uniref:Sulphur transport domain-containing protein n=1 Tax=Paracoccus cavernae TaxID=1571207 RepID=A0ABT8D415_9RHOB|nr:hypothetical protein [Paracoccus cavernae]